MNRIKRGIWSVVMLVALALTGCTQSNASENDTTAVSIGGYNHVTGQNVNWFSVNGYRTTLTGNSCCVMIPDRWRPGLTAHIEWEVDPFPNEDIKKKTKGFGYDPGAYAKHKAKYQHYSADVSIPKYDHLGGFSVHFLPCQQVKVYTGTEGPNSPAYPIKEPFDMKESATCQK